MWVSGRGQLVVPSVPQKRKSRGLGVERGGGGGDENKGGGGGDDNREVESLETLGFKSIK